jgi:YD repeat-containing protein
MDKDVQGVGASVWLARLVGFLPAVVAMAAAAQEIIPDFYRDPGVYPNRSYVNQSFNEHIDPFTGSLQQHYVDLYLPGNGGFDLKIVRSYNSSSVDPLNPASYESQSGLGWTIHMGRVISKDTTICLNKNAQSSTDNPVLELPDGSRQLLSFTGGTAPLMLTAQRWRADCSSAGSGGLVVYSPDGVRYDMTQQVSITSGVKPLYAWFTTKITDRNGNFANVSYAAAYSPELKSVTASDGRSIAFTYADAGLYTRRITSVSGAGQQYNYVYTAVNGVADKYYLSAVQRPDGTQWGYAYNQNIDPTAGSYAMSQVTYPQGGQITYGYDYVYFDTQANPSSRSAVVVRKQLSSGGTWAFNYSPGGVGAYDVTSVTTPSGNITYQHIGAGYVSGGTVWMVGLLASKKTGNLRTETYTWDRQQISSESYSRPGAFVTKVDSGATYAPVLTKKQISQDGATYTTNFSNFDSYGNPGTVAEVGTNGGSRTTSISYYIDTNKWIINQLQNESFTGSSVTRSFDSNGNLQSLTRDGVSTTFTYDLEGNVASVKKPRGLQFNYSNYMRGIAKNESQPEGIAISRIVSDAGNVTSETNGEGKTTKYTYDLMNRVSGITYPIGNPVTIQYTANSKKATRGGLVETTSYTSFGYVSAVTLGGINRAYQVDALGRRTFESNPGAAIGTTYQYDIMDRVIRATNPDQTFSSIAYGASTKTVTDERSKATTYTYRAYGDPDRTSLMAVAAPESTTSITILRNSKDLVTSVTQAGVTRSYEYNTNYYLTGITNPETGKTVYGRDAAGNLTSRVVGTSAATTFTYDGQNRLNAVTYPGTTPSLTYTYNKQNKMLSATSSTGGRTLAYDDNGNLTSETLSVDGYALTATYAYNSNDQLASITYPFSTRIVNYAPDALGRPTQVSGYVDSVLYWPSGQLKQIKYSNGVTTDYDQNSRLWPSKFVTTPASGSVFRNWTYAYDGAGNLLSITDAIDSSRSRTMTYDGVNRLTSGANQTESATYAYDGADNLTKMVSGNITVDLSYTSNKLTKVVMFLPATYSYDVYGNITSMGSTQHQFDDVPNLRCFDCASATNKTEYKYDALGHRDSVLKGGVQTYEMTAFNGNQLIEFVPAQANKLVEYIYLGGKRVAQRVSP